MSGLKKHADRYFSKYIRYRDGRYSHELQGWETMCITCGKWAPIESMQNGHFVTRSNTTLRYNEENCNAQCYSCNVMRHGDLYTYAKELDAKYGKGTAERLHSQRHAVHKLSVPELQQIIEDAKVGIAFRTGSMPS